MKILQVYKSFYTVGGASNYFFELSKLLMGYKQEIAFFSTQNSKNQKSKWSKYFVDNIDFKRKNLTNVLRNFLRMIYSIEARNKISILLDNNSVNVAHLHSIAHKLSPSLISELRKRNIPIVQTVHEYHLISPTYNMFHDGKICETTKPDKFYKAILHRCVRHSYIASLVEVLEKYLHYWLGWERNDIDYFIAPSKFMRKKLIEYGLPKEKIIHLPHFINSKEYEPNYETGHDILYFGRLSPEKGINYLIEAMKLIPQVKLIIAGRGSQEQELKKLNKGLGNKNVDFVGFQEGTNLKKLIANSKFTVLPSVWYEVFGLSILESFASGKPVIASNIGGIPETVKDGFNGLLVEPGNVSDLAEKINKLWNDQVLVRDLGKNAREYVEKKFGSEEHYGKLMEIYRRAIKRHKN